MEEGGEETGAILSRKELRKQKLMEYLAGKGKLKQPNPKPYLRDDCQAKKHVTTSLKVVQGKENKAPADRFTHEGTTMKPPAGQATKQPAARKTFGDSKKVNVKANVLTGRQNTNRPPAAGVPAQPRLDHNPALTRRSTALSSRGDPNAAAGHLKKQPNAEMPRSGGSHSNASRPAGTKSNCRFSGHSKATWSCPLTTASDRMSVGPTVKTRTGLIPAVTQPRNGASRRVTRTSAAATGAKKAQSSGLPLVSVSQTSAAAQRKPLPTTSLNNHERARAGAKVPNQSNSKPLSSRNSQPSSKIQLSSGLKSTAGPLKPRGGRAGAAGQQPTHRLITKPRSDSAGRENSQPCKVAPRTSSGPASRCGSRALSGVPPAAVAERGGKTETREEGKANTANALPSQTGMKRTNAPGTSHTVPRPSRPSRPIGHTVPVGLVPQTEGKKVTAAQEERMRKLQEWREAKGISYKRPPMPAKPQVRRPVAAALQPFWGAMNEEDEAHSLICAVDRSLADCIKLLGEGCPPGRVKEILSRLPAVSKKFAKYWICRARLLEAEGHLDVLPMFEEAVGVVLEPVDELRDVVFEILKKKDEIPASAEEEDGEEDGEEGSPTCERSPESVTHNPMMTPKPVRAFICGEKGDSSVVKYKVTATPGGPPSQQREPARVNGQEVRFFTPVRRSVRIERTSLRYPASLQDHDLCVASYGDLIHEEDGESGEEQKGGGTPMYVYRRNEALEDKVFVQLVYDEAV